MELTVCELFAGVGGFHLGLTRSGWKVVWANQWEPGKKEQHAYKCYISNFPDTECVNEDIAIAKEQIPQHTLLVGGFPCQDYSVATTKAKGIHGKKGVLWWEINDIVTRLSPPFILLENVDRLIRSPAKQRGKDFAIILSCLNKLGYVVEWRVINAADYGFPQRRRRTFIFATNKKAFIKHLYNKKQKEIILRNGFFAREFEVIQKEDVLYGSSIINESKIPEDLLSITKKYQFDFCNAGMMIDGVAYTVKVNPIKSPKCILGSILQKDADSSLYLSRKDIFAPKGWKYCKGAKNEPRKTNKGYIYNYTEGAIPFPDKLDEPSRTLLTSEGSKNPNRISHVVKDPWTGKLRILTPVELELLNGFEKDWTKNIPIRWRYFCMGNALVVGLTEKIGRQLKTIIDQVEKTSKKRSRMSQEINITIKSNHVSNAQEKFVCNI